MSVNPRRQMMRKRRIESAVEMERKRKALEQQNAQYLLALRARTQAVKLTADYMEPRVPSWARWVSMHMLPGERFETAMQFISMTLPGRWDDFLTNRLYFPPQLVALLLMPYNALMLLLSLVLVTPIRWLRRAFYNCGMRYRWHWMTTSEGPAIRVVIRNFWLHVVCEEVVFAKSDTQKVRRIVTPAEDQSPVRLNRGVLDEVLRGGSK